MNNSPQNAMRHLKHFSDYLLAVFLIIVFFPLFLLTAMIVFLLIDRKIFFTQERPGLNNEIFTIYKFKTMNDASDVNGELLSDDLRLTSCGKMIRSLSLDELPQLLNILKGELSFVGPRPLLVEYLPLYSDEQLRRHSVKPGITGWAQVNGRNNLNWKEKFDLDLWYINNWSLTLDLKIALMTVKKIFIREGINPQGRTSTEKFKGNN